MTGRSGSVGRPPQGPSRLNVSERAVALSAQRLRGLALHLEATGDRAGRVAAMNIVGLLLRDLRDRAA